MDWEISPDLDLKPLLPITRTCEVTQNVFNISYVDGQGVSGAYVVVSVSME